MIPTSMVLYAAHYDLSIYKLCIPHLQVAAGCSFDSNEFYLFFSKELPLDMNMNQLFHLHVETLGKNKKSGLFGVPCDLWQCLKTAIVRSGKKEGGREGIGKRVRGLQ